MARNKDHLRLYLFGRFRGESAQGPVRLPTRKARALLAYLVLHPEGHAREKLAALFWGDVPDASARASLRNALAILRRLLGKELLLADRETVRLNPSFPLWVDALALQAQASHFLQASSPDPDSVDVALYTGDLLAEFYDDWVLVAREQFRALYVETLLALAQQMRARSAYERAVEFARRALAIDRAEERAHQHLIVCHVALGNRGAALAQVEACRQALQEELAVEPSPATKKLAGWIRQASPERLPVEAAITNLPIAPTPFVGRQRQMAALKERLASVRLMTLTGAGGSGKTRLAIQVAMDLLAAYADGVWWVELAALSEAALVPHAVARALGVPEVAGQPVDETLASFLRARQLLIVLDNCEHLIAASARLVERLLGGCPQLTILATSREALAIPGEHVWPVPPLSLPDAPQAGPPDLLHAEAVRLFVDRAGAARPDFTLTGQNAEAVVAICTRLDGLPLAIELAAARVGALTIEQIAARLNDTFRLLTAGSRTALPRHQTLRAAIDWSYDLLPGGEQRLFRRLSVFAGGWTLEAAEAVCAGESIAEHNVVDLLAQLVAKSLVEMRPQEEGARYRLLQTIRQYGKERLVESGESAPVRDRHRDYFLQLVGAAGPHLGYFLPDGESSLWLPRLAAEEDNLRAALHWSLEQAEARPGAAEAGLRLVSNLHWFWFSRGEFSEGRAWLDKLLLMNARVAAATRAQALLAAGYLACWQGDFAAGRPPLEQALALYRRLEDGAGIAFAQHGLGFVALGEGNLPLSRSLLEASVQGARQMGDPWLTSFALHFLAIVLTYQEQYDPASAYFHEGNALIAPLGGHRQGLAFSLFHLARIARLQSDFSEARSRLVESLQIFRQTGDRRGIGYALAGLAVLAAAQGELRRAARLGGAVTALQTLIGPFLELPLQVEYDQALAAVRAALAGEAFSAALAQGQSLTLAQAVALAQDSPHG